MNVGITQTVFDEKYGRLEKRKRTWRSFLPTPKDALGLFPIINTARNYKKSFIVGDVTAGFTVAVMHIPQGMAYAALASLSPVYGLYVSFFAPIIYTFLGSSNHASIATFAPVSIMVGQFVDSALVANNCTESCSGVDDISIKSAAALNFVVGSMLLLMSVLQLGFIGDYFSRSMVKGLTLGIAFHVMTSQVKKALDFAVKSMNGPGSLLLTWFEVIKNIEETNLCSLIIAAVCIVLLTLTMYANDFIRKKKFPVPIPIELILVISGTVVSDLLSFEKVYDISIVGKVPVGLPMPEFPLTDMPVEFVDLLQPAITITLVSFAVTLALGKTFAERKGYTINANQELFALGSTDFLTSFFSCFPASASPSRSSVQIETGGSTQLVSLLSSCLLLSVLLFFGKFVTALPMAVLAGIIMFALRSYFMQLTQIPELWRRDKLEVLIFLSTAVVTICVDISSGLIFGIAFSLAIVLWRLQTPEYVQLGRIVGTSHFRDVERYARADAIPGLLIFRYNMSLFYANSERFITAVKQQVQERQASPIEGEDKLSVVILDFETFNFIDHSGILTLFSLKSWLEKQAIKLVVSRCRFDILQKLKNDNLFAELGDSCVFPSVYDAVMAFTAETSISDENENSRKIISNGENHRVKDETEFSNPAQVISRL